MVVNNFNVAVLNNETADLLKIKAIWKSALTIQLVIG